VSTNQSSNPPILPTTRMDSNLSGSPQPILPPVMPAKRRSMGWVWLLLIVGGAIAYFVFHGSTQTVANAQIVSPTEIQFDYTAASNCANMTFQYTFYDASGTEVSVFNGQQSHSVTGGQTSHVTSDATPPDTIDPTATRFDVAATCHDQ
jgi:hypothetical protein